MTTTTDILATVDDLAPTITARAEEIEAARRLPLDLVDKLRAAGCFSMLRPASHGGAGLDLPAALRVVETLSRADGSVGWTVMIGASAWCDLGGLPRATFDALFAEDPDAIVGGAFSPSGTAVRVDDGYKVTGRWGFASGCEHSTWLFANCIEETSEGPGLRLVTLAPDEVEIQDTWKVSGLCGTGSHHFAVNDLIVPFERTYRTLEAEPCLDEPLLRIPVPALASIEIATVALGVAQGAHDEILALAAGKVPLLASSTLAGNPLFQRQLAVADTELRAARSLLYEVAGDAWATAVDRAPFELDQRARIRATACWVTARATSVVDTSYHAGGGSSLYLDNPLQRRLRDIHALTQHFLIAPDTLTTAGALLAGQDLDLPIF